MYSGTCYIFKNLKGIITSEYASLPDDSCNVERVENFFFIRCTVNLFTFSVENHNSFQCDLCIGFMGKTNDHSMNMLISCGHKLLLNIITLSVLVLHSYLFPRKFTKYSAK